MGCSNCGDPSHILMEYPKEIKLMRAAKSRLEYMERKTGKKRSAHAVLFAPYHQLSESADKNSSAAGTEDEKDSNTDQELFSRLMAAVESDLCRV